MCKKNKMEKVLKELTKYTFFEKILVAQTSAQKLMHFDHLELFPSETSNSRREPPLVEVVIYHSDASRAGLAYFALVGLKFLLRRGLGGGGTPRLAGGITAASSAAKTAGWRRRGGRQRRP